MALHTSDPKHYNREVFIKRGADQEQSKSPSGLAWLGIIVIVSFLLIPTLKAMEITNLAQVTILVIAVITICAMGYLVVSIFGDSKY